MKCSCENILSRDVNYNENDYKDLLLKYKNREFMAMPEYRYILLQKRDIEKEDYTENKDNFERLFLERFTDGQYKRLIKRMKNNGWTTKELFSEVCKTGRLADYISTIKLIS